MECCQPEPPSNSAEILSTGSPEQPLEICFLRIDDRSIDDQGRKNCQQSCSQGGEHQGNREADEAHSQIHPSACVMVWASSHEHARGAPWLGSGLASEEQVERSTDQARSGCPKASVASIARSLACAPPVDQESRADPARQRSSAAGPAPGDCFPTRSRAVMGEWRSASSPARPVRSQRPYAIMSGPVCSRSPPVPPPNIAATALANSRG